MYSCSEYTYKTLTFMMLFFPAIYDVLKGIFVSAAVNSTVQNSLSIIPLTELCVVSELLR